MIDDFSRPPEPPRRKFDSLRRRVDFTKPDSQPLVTPSINDEVENTPAGPAFRSPEQVAVESRGHFLPPLEAVDMLPEHATADPAKGWKKFLKRPTKKQAIIMGVVALLALGGGIAFGMTQKKPAPAEHKIAVAPKPTPTPKPIVSPLSGLPVSIDKTTLPVTGAMIENSSDARPQSGLDQASVVFEAIAEAGITRFLALYQDNSPQTLGPVRSSRPYYLDWAMAFDAGYAHVGGSPDALQRIKDISVRDLDQFYNSSAYHRISTRYAPHNMYTSIDALQGLERAKGYTTSTFTSLVRKAKEEPGKTPTARAIDFNISSSYYNVHYDYDAATNSYKRSEGGAAHVDNETKQQLSPKVVVALAMPYSLMSDGYHSMYNTIGSGQMLVFQDGVVTPGTWSKGQPKDQFVFKDDSGKDLGLNPGQTWITVLSDISKATYTP